MKFAAIDIGSNNFVEGLDKDKTYLYIDMGGGSTELTLISEKEIAKSQSFNLGTVRILKEKDTKEEWQHLKSWLPEQATQIDVIEAIGSGGNINKIHSLSSQSQDKPLSYKKVKQIHDQLNSLTFEQRVRNLNMRPDRADVIVPAGRLFKSIMKWAHIDQIWVPQIGLSDGIVHVLYEKQKNETLNF